MPCSSHLYPAPPLLIHFPPCPHLYQCLLFFRRHCPEGSEQFLFLLHLQTTKCRLFDQDRLGLQNCKCSFVLCHPHLVRGWSLFTIKNPRPFLPPSVNLTFTWLWNLMPFQEHHQLDSSEFNNVLPWSKIFFAATSLSTLSTFPSSSSIQ